ncbi:hypothetical protein EVAR_31406_1 [Eumeta japonica]|uniref:Uncharacterized protein n=1 Tax=Eumeta variegata TaxID=151549 RepID=A0A4C1UXR0_EUMVA|nr:hypothetical protein EVAR_31406_1 [Eumeta japonica]
MTFFYYLSLLTLRLKALTKYVGGEEVCFQEEIYQRRGHIMRIKVIFALYKKVALWAASLEDRINVLVVFLLLSIYSNLFIPLRMTLQLFSKHYLNESPNHWASLTYFIQHVPTFTCYRIANLDRSLVFKFLAAVVIHGALQGQFEVAQEAARLKTQF